MMEQNEWESLSPEEKKGTTLSQTEGNVGSLS